MNSKPGKRQGSLLSFCHRVRSRVLPAALLVAAAALPARAGLFDDGPSSKPPPPKKPLPPLPPLPPIDVPPSERAQPNTPVAPTSPGEPEKLPIPSDAMRRAAMKQVRDVLRDELTKARTAADKSSLAVQMLQTADTTADAPGKYALIREAETLAADANDVDTVLAAQDAAERAFQPDLSPAATDPLQQLSRAPINAEASGRVCEAALGILRGALAVNRFDAARQAGKVAVAMAHKANNRELTDRATAQMAGVTACEAEYGRVLPSETALKKSPDDPAANAAVGRYDCFFKGDWSAGLPKLAKGNNDSLKKAAGDELKPPSDPAAQAAVADAWWGLADGQPPAVQATVRAHAAKWYAQAIDGLTGLAKLKAQQRLAQAQPPAPPPAVASARPVKPLTPSTPEDPSTGTGSGSSGPTEITGPLDIIRSVPADMYPKTVTEWTEDRQRAVDEAMRKAVGGQKGTFQVVVQELYASSGRVLTRSMLVGKVSFRMTLYFDSDARGPLSSLRIGQPCIVTGTISYPRFEGMELIVTMQHCSVGR